MKNITETNICPVCGKAEVEYMEVCPVCEWQNDFVQRKHPDWQGGANNMSLNEAKKAYSEGRAII